MQRTSKLALAYYFAELAYCQVSDSQDKPHSGYITALQHEDGSGHSFNVSMNEYDWSKGYCVLKQSTFHLRTID